MNASIMRGVVTKLSSLTIRHQATVLLHKMYKVKLKHGLMCVSRTLMSNYCMKPHKIKGEKCALFSILCASVLYLTQVFNNFHKCAVLSL